MAEMTGSDILDISRHMSACIAHAYFIILMMLLSVLIGYPLICCFNVCNRKISDPTKYPYQMCIQSVLLFTTMCFLLVGAGSSWHAGFEMQTALEVLPSAARNAVKNIDIAVSALKTDGIWFNTTLSEQLKLLKASNQKIPRVVKIFEKKVNPHYNICVKNIIEAVRGIYDVFNTLERIRTRNHLNAFAETYEYVRSNAEKHIVNLPGLDLKITENRTLFYSINNTGALSGIMKQWNMNKKYIDGVNGITPFISHIEHDVLEVVANNTLAIEIFEEGLKNVTKIVTGTVGFGSSISEHVLASIENASVRINGIVKGYKSDSPSRYYKISAYILLLPSTLGFVVFTFFVLGFVRSFKDIQNSNIGKLADCKSLLFFKLAINLSVPFLWLILLGAAALYCIHVPATVFCGLVANNQILTNYFDQPLWNNSTYMTNKLNDIAHVNLDIRISDILRTCQNGSTYNHTKLQEVTSTIMKHELFSNVINFNMHKVISIFENVDFCNYYNLDSVYGLMDFTIVTLSNSVLEEAYFNLNETSKKIAILQDIFENSTGFLYRKELRHMKFNILEMKKDLASISKIKNVLLDKVVENFQEFNKSVILWTLNYDNRHIGPIHRFLASLDMECLAKQMKSVSDMGLFGKMGNCSFLPDTYYKMNHIICDYALVVLNTLWLSLVILSGSILVASMLSCKLAQYVRGAIRNQQLQMIELQRYSSIQSHASSETTTEIPLVDENKQTTV